MLTLSREDTIRAEEAAGQLDVDAGIVVVRIPKAYFPYGTSVRNLQKSNNAKRSLLSLCLGAQHDNVERRVYVAVRMLNGVHIMTYETFKNFFPHKDEYKSPIPA